MSSPRYVNGVTRKTLAPSAFAAVAAATPFAVPPTTSTSVSTGISAPHAARHANTAIPNTRFMVCSFNER